MREIKFRGKGLSGCSFGLLTVNTKKDGNYEWFISNEAGNPYAYVVNPSTIGQFTGLKDINGVEIYEGDIVASKGHYFSQKGIVVFEDRGWKIKISEMSHFFTDRVWENIEVVGNIHDNGWRFGVRCLFALSRVSASNDAKPVLCGEANSFNF